MSRFYNCIILYVFEYVYSWYFGMDTIINQSVCILQDRRRRPVYIVQFA